MNQISILSNLLVEKAYIGYFKFQEFRQIELVQKIIDVSCLFFGIKGAHELYVMKNNNANPNPSPNSKTKKYKFIKLVRILGNISLIGTGIGCRPVQILFHKIITHLFTPEQLNRFLAPHLIEKSFYLINLASFILGIPSNCKFTYDCYCWLKKKIALPPKQKAQEQNAQRDIRYKEIKARKKGKTFYTFVELRTFIQVIR